MNPKGKLLYNLLLPWYLDWFVFSFVKYPLKRGEWDFFLSDDTELISTIFIDFGGTLLIVLQCFLLFLLFELNLIFSFVLILGENAT